jgi:hypothetical protein
MLSGMLCQRRHTKRGEAGNHAVAVLLMLLVLARCAPHLCSRQMHHQKGRLCVLAWCIQKSHHDVTG